MAGFTPEMRAKAAATRAAKKAAKAVVAAATPTPVRTAGQFSGLSVTDCCLGCTPDACVISGKPYCAHPAKGGLQPGDVGSPAALSRLNQAKQILGDRKIAV